jgi:hypothetical protein
MATIFLNHIMKRVSLRNFLVCFLSFTRKVVFVPEPNWHQSGRFRLSSSLVYSANSWVMSSTTAFDISYVMNNRGDNMMQARNATFVTHHGCCRHRFDLVLPGTTLAETRNTSRDQEAVVLH